MKDSSGKQHPANAFGYDSTLFTNIKPQGYKKYKRHPMTRKPKSLKTLVKDLDAIFSKYIRLSNANDTGYCTCCTCGKMYKWDDSSRINCGHYIGRQHKAHRWNERNCKPQCARCNNWGQGEQVKFFKYLVAKYGAFYVDWLDASPKERKWSRFELETMIGHYKQLMEAL